MGGDALVAQDALQRRPSSWRVRVRDAAGLAGRVQAVKAEQAAAEVAEPVAGELPVAGSEFGGEGEQLTAA